MSWRDDASLLCIWLPWLLFMISSSWSRHWHLMMTHLHVVLHDHTGLDVVWGTYMWTRFGSVPSSGGRLPFRELLFMCLDKPDNQESVQVVSLRHHKLWAAILTSRHTQPSGSSLQHRSGRTNEHSLYSHRLETWNTPHICKDLGQMGLHHVKNVHKGRTPNPEICD